MCVRIYLEIHRHYDQFSGVSNSPQCQHLGILHQSRRVTKSIRFIRWIRVVPGGWLIGWLVCWLTGWWDDYMFMCCPICMYHMLWHDKFQHYFTIKFNYTPPPRHTFLSQISFTDCFSLFLIWRELCIECSPLRNICSLLKTFFLFLYDACHLFHLFCPANRNLITSLF